MRIALVSPLPPYRGGIAAFSHLLGTHLLARHELYAVNFRRLYPPFFFPGQSQTLTTATVPLPAPADTLLDSLLPASWDRAARRIRDFRPDVSIFAYWMPYFIPAYWRMLALLRPHGRAVILCHNVEEHENQPGLRWLKRRFFGAADGLVVLSDDGRRQLQRLAVSTPAATLFHPTYPGYGDGPPQAEAKARLGLDSGTPMILFFGLVRPYKGLAHLLEAARLLQQRGVRFHLRVAGEFYQGYQEAARAVARHGLTHSVVLENRFIPDREVATYFSAADVVVLPYLSATQSGVVQLAYQFQRPVVVTAVGGLAEVVQPGRTGFVVPPADGAALADVLAKNLPAGFAKLRGAVASAREAFTWERFIARLEHFLA